MGSYKYSYLFPTKVKNESTGVTVTYDNYDDFLKTDQRPVLLPDLGLCFNIQNIIIMKSGLGFLQQSLCWYGQCHAKHQKSIRRLSWQDTLVETMK